MGDFDAVEGREARGRPADRLRRARCSDRLQAESGEGGALVVEEPVERDGGLGVVEALFDDVVAALSGLMISQTQSGRRAGSPWEVGHAVAAPAREVWAQAALNWGKSTSLSMTIHHPPGLFFPSGPS